MVDHYYSRSPEVQSNPKYWHAQLNNHSFQFKTDQGVFSKKEVDFGSRFLIEMFHCPDVSGPLLDAGCGYGPIGLALAKDNPNRIIHMIDINQRAIQLAAENATLNNVANVEIYESNLFDQVENDQFAAVVTNPPIRAGKQVVHQLFENSLLHLKSEGELWVVIQKKQGAPSAKTKLEELFKKVDIVAKRKGYYLLKAVKD